MQSDPSAHFDSRFSAPGAVATPWTDAERALEEAELYWLTTVRADGRPHVTPLIGLFHDGAMHFTTGPDEQKARNLQHSARVALTTGNNTWKRGLDVVVEGTAVRVTDSGTLQRLADGIESKYAGDWHFDVEGDMFSHPDGGTAAVFRIEADKVMAFAKDPHGQTTYRFGER